MIPAGVSRETKLGIFPKIVPIVGHTGEVSPTGIGATGMVQKKALRIMLR